MILSIVSYKENGVSRVSWAIANDDVEIETRFDGLHEETEWLERIEPYGDPTVVIVNDAETYEVVSAVWNTHLIPVFDHHQLVEWFRVCQCLAAVESVEQSLPVNPGDNPSLYVEWLIESFDYLQSAMMSWATLARAKTTQADIDILKEKEKGKANG